MPIRPENKALYPPDWKQIRERILARAGNRCEQCGVHNRAIGWRNDVGVFNLVEYEGTKQRLADLQFSYGDMFKLIMIVLTIAHLEDPTPGNCADHNLSALCQRCHLRLDAPMHRVNSAATRRAKANTPDMFAEQLLEFRASVPPRDTSSDAAVDAIMEARDVVR